MSMNDNRLLVRASLMSIKAVAGRVQKQWMPKGKVLRKVPGMPPREASLP